MICPTCNTILKYKQKKMVHGKGAAYQMGCRCEICKKKHNAYMRKYREKHPELKLRVR